MAEVRAHRGWARQVWEGLAANKKDGAMPLLLLGLTVVTGVVDSVSILALGRVFVANMTGNVVFVGFAISGAPGFSLTASLFALAGFLLGAFGGGYFVEKFGARRESLLRDAIGVELGLVAAALFISLAVPTPFGSPAKDAIAGVTAVALGLQNSVARRLAVADLTTTVLTMTLTGIAADLRSGDVVVVARRLLAVTTMLAGAVAGALLVLHVSASAALGLATGLLFVIGASALFMARHDVVGTPPATVS